MADRWNSSVIGHRSSVIPRGLTHPGGFWSNGFMDEKDRVERWPPYAFVPGGPWPHPTRSAEGHSFGQNHPSLTKDDHHARSAVFQRGLALFQAGYYWEAHESWESLWHAEGRTGASADVLRGLIKLAAAGVKVRERQPHGIITHARRAAELFERVQRESGDILGLDLLRLAAIARDLASSPPNDPGSRLARVTRVFDFEIPASSDPGNESDEAKV